MALPINFFDGNSNLPSAIAKASFLPPRVNKNMEVSVIFYGHNKKRKEKTKECLNLLDDIGCNYYIETEDGIISTRNTDLDRKIYFGKEDGIGLENGRIIPVNKIRTINILSRKSPEVNIIAVERYEQVRYNAVVYSNTDKIPCRFYTFSEIKNLKEQLEKFALEGVPQRHPKLNAMHYRITSKINRNKLEDAASYLAFHLVADTVIESQGDEFILTIDGFFPTLYRKLNLEEKKKLSDLVYFEEVEHAEKAGN